jgi:type II secretory pathway pseudopilin PulG
VVAIILIIAAIAIPNLVRSRIAAKKASAVGSLRTINTAEITYSLTFPATGFVGSLTALGPEPTAGAMSTSTYAQLLDNVLGCGRAPLLLQRCVGVIRYNTTVTASSTDLALQ